MRWQLPAYSPVGLRALALASVRTLSGAEQTHASLSEYLRARYRAEAVVLTGSGTQALQLALTISKARFGHASPVSLPAYSCYDLVSASVGAGVPMSFYDVDPLTLSFDEVSLRAVAGRRPGAIVAANLFSYPLDWTALRRMAEQEDLFLIEDASQGLGGSWDGTPTGALGDVTVLSFGRGKGWTGGAGGALLVRDERALGELDRMLASPEALLPSAFGRGGRAFVVLLALWALGRPRMYWIPVSVPGLGLGETVYKDPAPITEIPAFSAACALTAAEASHRGVGDRRGAAGRWSDLLDHRGGEAWSACEPLQGGTSGFLRFAALAPNAPERNAFAEEGGRFGVWGGYPELLPDLPAVRDLSEPSVGLRGAARLKETLVTLPTHEKVSAADVRGVAEVLGIGQN